MKKSALLCSLLFAPVTNSFRAAIKPRHTKFCMTEKFSPPSTLEDEELGPGTIVCGGVLDEEDDKRAVEESLSDTEVYKPRLLYWCKSQIEEDREINFYINSAFLLVIVGTVAFRLTVPTLDSSRGWTTGEVLFRLPQDNWQGYLDVLRAHPVFVKAVTSGSVYALGDYTAQTTNGTPLADLDRLRVVRSAVAGFIGHGPLSHYWYTICESFFDFIGCNSYWWVIFPKIVLDQFLWGPIWNATYVSLVGILKQDSFERVWEAVTSTAVPLVVSGLKLWPAVHIITYGFIPPENRLLWVDMVEILWVTILSRQAAEEAKKNETVS
mmetsp:Transcript_2269/g.3229  ORF Transcript_2269/g.3229 Transcript_2269/m.3229 type:complete len:324 (+) Transcript_2269:42-1013(+)